MRGGSIVVDICRFRLEFYLFLWIFFIFFGFGECREEEEEKLLVKVIGVVELK